MRSQGCGGGERNVGQSYATLPTPSTASSLQGKSEWTGWPLGSTCTDAPNFHPQPTATQLRCFDFATVAEFGALDRTNKGRCPRGQEDEVYGFFPLSVCLIVAIEFHLDTAVNLHTTATDVSSTQCWLVVRVSGVQRWLVSCQPTNQIQSASLNQPAY